MSSTVTVIGYYGNEDWLTLPNYLLMQKIVEKVVTEEFKLNLHDVVWICNGGTWCSHLPSTLFKKWSNGDPGKGKLILPYPWHEFSAVQTKHEIANKLRNSHKLMTKRLVSLDSQAELTDMVSLGCEVIVTGNKRHQFSVLDEKSNYVIWMPLKADDDNFLQGSTFFDQASSVKIIVPLSEFISEI